MQAKHVVFHSCLINGGENYYCYDYTVAEPSLQATFNVYGLELQTQEFSQGRGLETIQSSLLSWAELGSVTGLRGHLCCCAPGPQTAPASCACRMRAEAP